MPAPYAAENHGDEKDIYIHSNQVSLTKFGSSNRNTSTKTFSKGKLLNNHKKKNPIGLTTIKSCDKK